MYEYYKCHETFFRLKSASKAGMKLRSLTKEDHSTDNRET